MLRRIVCACSLAMPIAVAAAWFHVFGRTAAWAGPVHAFVAIAIALAALATVVAVCARSPRVHAIVASGLLTAQIAIMALAVGGVRLVDVELFPDHRLAITVALALALGVYGLARGRMWGRWLCLALGVVGAVSGGLNVPGFWKVTMAPDAAHLAWSMQAYEQTWVLLVMSLGGALVTLNLLAPAVVDQFAARARGTTWGSSDRVVGSLRLTLVAAFVAAPMLLVYAWLQPIVPATAVTAQVLAAAIAVGALLVVRGRVIGALLLVAAGLGLVAQTAATVYGATDSTQQEIALYYAVFWLPAAAVAIACGARLARPTLRLLRG